MISPSLSLSHRSAILRTFPRNRGGDRQEQTKLLVLMQAILGQKDGLLDLVKMSASKSTTSTAVSWSPDTDAYFNRVGLPKVVPITMSSDATISADAAARRGPIKSQAKGKGKSPGHVDSAAYNAATAAATKAACEFIAFGKDHAAALRLAGNSEGIRERLNAAVFPTTNAFGRPTPSSQYGFSAVKYDMTKFFAVLQRMFVAACAGQESAFPFYRHFLSYNSKTKRFGLKPPGTWESSFPKITEIEGYM
jgi:hypothetical protein